MDLVLLAAAGWLLFGPDAGVRRELEAWSAERRTRALVGERWPALVAAGGALGPGGPDDPTLVEFTDYRCPFCARAHAGVEALVEGERPVRVIIRHLPLVELHPDAGDLARVAVCAEDDPVFPAVHRSLFDAPAGRDGIGSPGVRPGPPSGHGGPGARGSGGDAPWPEMARLLEGAGVADPGAVLRCARSDRSRLRVEADLRLAAELGLTGTPTFIARDRVATGALSPGVLREMLGLREP